MTEEYAGLSGIDQIVLNAVAEGKAEADEEMLLAIRGMNQRFAAVQAKNDVTWGDQYVRHCEREVIAALHIFAGLETVTKRDAVALHSRLREYRRVADYADEIVLAGANAIRVMNGEDPLDDGVGEPLNGEAEFDAQGADEG